MTGEGPNPENRVEAAGCEDVNATPFAELDAAAWAHLSPEQPADVDMSAVPDEALPTDERCPRCHWPVLMVTTMGPHTHELTPCGCRVAVRDI